VAAPLGTYGSGLLGTAGRTGSPVTASSIAGLVDGRMPGDTTIAAGTTGTSAHLGITGSNTKATGGLQKAEAGDGSTTTGATTGGDAGSSGGAGAATKAATTQPGRTTTTNQQQQAAAQREKTAMAAVFHLGDAIISYFKMGDMSGLRSLVAAAAQASLTQMVSSLDKPYAYELVGTKLLAAGTVQVTIEFSDRIANEVGELVETAKRFAISVRVGDEGAVIAAISAGS
jgi:hypothetical protein